MRPGSIAPYTGQPANVRSQACTPTRVQGSKQAGRLLDRRVIGQQQLGNLVEVAGHRGGLCRAG